VRPEGRFKEKCGIAGYPVQEMSGLIFAYLGPAPVPYLPRWEPLEWENAVRDIAITVLPCNWLQCQENSLDPVYVEWLHAYYGMWLQSQRQELLSRALAEQHHMDIGFDVFEHGIIKRRVLKGYTQEDDDWKYGHPILFLNILLVGNQMNSTLQFRVPMDDTHTYHISYYAWQSAPGSEMPRRQERVPYRYVPLKDDQGGYVTNVLFNQDYMAWMTQGEIADRTLEKLGESDKGIILFRKMLQEQMAIAEDGGDPMNVFRSEEAARNVRIGIEQVKFGDKKLFARYFPGEAGYSTDAELVDEVLATWDKVLTEV
jgi:5,5'-dehydrodivanillate O-demethylase